MSRAPSGAQFRAALRQALSLYQQHFGDLAAQVFHRLPGGTRAPRAILLDVSGALDQWLDGMHGRQHAV